VNNHKGEKSMWVISHLEKEEKKVKAK